MKKALKKSLILAAGFSLLSVRLISCASTNQKSKTMIVGSSITL